jgi:hypothetical protein
MTARGLARAALADGELERAAAIAAGMIALDRGTSSVSRELLGEASARLARPDEARRALEAARDAVCGLMIGHSPRCPTAVQDELRQAAARHGFALVDLPRLFAQHLAGALPGRRIFLDYCHLTVEGMQIAMRAVAQCVAPLVAGTESASDLPVAPEDEGMAHFLAAIHNRHYGQDSALLRYHCRRAIAHAQLSRLRGAPRGALDVRARRRFAGTARQKDRTRPAPTYRCAGRSSAPKSHALGIKRRTLRASV